MTTTTASIWVELEIKVSGTHVPSEPMTYEPPYPGSPGGWEDITIEGIAHEARCLKGGKVQIIYRDLLPTGRMYAGIFSAFLGNIEAEFSEQIAEALTAELPERGED